MATYEVRLENPDLPVMQHAVGEDGNPRYEWTEVIGPDGETPVEVPMPVLEPETGPDGKPTGRVHWRRMVCDASTKREAEALAEERESHGGYRVTGSRRL